MINFFTFYAFELCFRIYVNVSFLWTLCTHDCHNQFYDLDNITFLTLHRLLTHKLISKKYKVEMKQILRYIFQTMGSGFILFDVKRNAMFQYLSVACVSLTFVNSSVLETGLTHPVTMAAEWLNLSLALQAGC